MHNPPHQSQKYAEKLDTALENSFLRKTLDTFAVAYKTHRDAVFTHIDAPHIIEKIAQAKDYTAQNLEKIYEEFKRHAEAKGVIVHRAATAEQANEIIARIAKDGAVQRIAKSKSMTSEETQLNAYLEAQGFMVDETDLGEYIIQLRGEGPSHMVMPAIHLSRYEVAEDFTQATGQPQDHDVDHLVKVARKTLRAKFVEADMGITGANFCVAETGSFATCTNEGNARLVSTLPRIHVAIAGLDKLIPTLDDAMNALQILPRNATAQLLTTYVTWFTGPGQWQGADTEKKKEMHMVFLDNGRTEIAKDPLFSQIFRCVRCGACANVCPVYRLVGGHGMGHIYIGAIGLILTYFFHGKEKAKELANNCIQCEACKHICAGGIDLPRLICEIRQRLTEEDGAALHASLLSAVMKNRRLFHSLLKFAKYAQLPATQGAAYQRHLPAIFLGKHGFKALPAIAHTSFRDTFASIQPKLSKPRLKIALFAGCAQDFIYPEQLKAAVEIFSKLNVAVDFPLQQSCCGLPLEVMGQRKASYAVAQQNIAAFSGKNYDAIVTLCASCASHLKHKYKQIIEKEDTLDTASQKRCKDFVQKITDFSSFIHTTLGISAQDMRKSTEKVTYHAACHLCRGLGITQEPRALINMAADYVPSKEEEVCCGFGGSYSVKFPGISKNLLHMKLHHALESGASRLVVDCPGCLMHLDGGVEKEQMKLKISHIAELVAENLQK